MRQIFLAAVVAFFSCISTAMLGAGNFDAPRKIDWPHGGPFGTFDRASLQRGLQVYQEVCAGCHSLRLIAFRTLSEIGLNEEEVKALASEATFLDGPNDDGEMFERPGKPSDYFPSPFPNEKAARVANNGAFPPDLSLIIKSRAGSENYLFSLLSGYQEAPDGVKMAEGMYYNPYFPGHQIAMAPPLTDEAVEYADSTKASIEQMSKDVSAFLAWAAEPTLEDRRRMGVKVILFLLVFAGVLFLAKRKIWSNVS